MNQKLSPTPSSTIKTFSTLQLALRRSLFFVLTISMVTGGHLPIRAAHAATVSKPSSPLGISDDSDIIPATRFNDNEDPFRLLNLSTPIPEQSNIDPKHTFFAFHQPSQDSSHSVVLDHFSADRAPQLLTLSSPVDKITLQDPGKQEPYLEFRVDQSRNETITQALHIDGILYFVTTAKASATGADLESKLHMIDLNRYKLALGKARPPIFTASIPAGAKLSFDGERLTAGDADYDFRVLQHYRRVQELIFNVTVNLLDPKTYDDTRELIGDLQTYMDRSEAILAETTNGTAKPGAHNLQDTYNQYVQGELKKLESQRELAKGSITEEGVDLNTPKGQEKFQAALAQNATTIEGLFKQTAAANKKSRFLNSRTELVSRILQKPRYFGGRLYIKALETLAVSRRLSPEAQVRYDEAIKQGRLPRFASNLALSKKFMALTVVSLAVYDPDHAKAILLNAQDMSMEVFHWAKGLIEISVQAVKDSTASIWDAKHVIYDKLLAPGQRHKLAWAMFGMFSSFGVIALSSHFGVVAVKIQKEFWANRRAEKRAGKTSVTSFKDFLIERQKKKEAEYLKSLEIAASTTYDTDHVWSDAEQREIAEIVKRYDNRKKSLADKFFGLMDSNKAHNIVTFKDALKHCMLSMAGFTDSQQSLMVGYNDLFYWRSFLRFPGMDWMSLRYPNAVKVLMSRDDSVVMPTIANGGLRQRFEAAKLKTQGFDLEELKIWEDRVIEVESAIEKQVLQLSLSKLTNFIADAGQLRDFYSSGGIGKISDPTIDSLPQDAKTYFLSFYEVLSTEMMREFLKDLAKRYTPEEQLQKDPESMSITELKAATIKAVDRLKLSSADAENYMERVLQRIDIDETVSRKIKSSDATWMQKYRWTASRRLDPAQNKQAARVHKVRTLSKIPKAVVRAVRAAITEIIIDKPLEFVQTMVLMAGVQTGIGSMFGNEMFGENSIFYLGRFTFLYGFVWGTFFSILSASASKLQFDEMNHSHFDNIPRGEDAKKSFISYYLKFLNPFNKKNPHQFLPYHWNIINNMVIPNIPAYLTLSIPIQLLFLGRFEVDTLFMGYMTTFFMGTSTYDAYADQAYEFAANHTLRDIPEKYHNHPEILTRNAAIQRITRFKVNLFTKSIQNVISSMTTVWMTIGVAGGETKALMRHFMGGYTPVELIVNPTRVLREVTADIPFIKHIGAAPNAMCEWLLTRTYEDGSRLLPRK